MENSVKERLLRFIDENRIGKTKFEKTCGLSNGYLNSLRHAPTQDKLSNILNAYPQLNRVWLLTGEGEMYNRDDTDGREDDERGNVDYVPLIPVEAFAGPLENWGRQGVTLRECELVVSPVPGAEFAIDVTGDSMEPEIPNGARVFMRRINDRAFIPWGHTLVIDSENGVYIKKVFPPTATDPDCIEARSANPAYPPMHIPTASIFGLYRVLATVKAYMTM